MDQEIMNRFQELVTDHGLLETRFSCTTLAKGYANTLPHQTPNGFSLHYFRLPSEEYALVKGKEVLIRCRIGRYFGDAFTDAPQPMHGKLKEIFNLDLENSATRAVFFATLNTTLRKLGLIRKTVHCTEDTPIKCGKKLAHYIQTRFGKVRVAHIGYQPGHVKACAQFFKSQVTDKDPSNIGHKKFGRTVLSDQKNEEVIKTSDVVCITGSAAVNGTLSQLLEWCETYHAKPIIYGVTGKGLVKMQGLHGFCPFGRNNP
ncbi:MAG: Rossmann-like domain-containing protein [Candidatus Ranarchaeia archaeon]